MNTTQRFLDAIELPATLHSCWLWVAGKTQGGYGCIKVDGKVIRSHRFSYAHFVGPIPEGMVVRHSCDTPACVNPRHLSLGTQKDNIHDMLGKGRGYQLNGTNKWKKSGLPLGVSPHRHKYQVHKNRRTIGVYDTVEQAVAAYQSA